MKRLKCIVAYDGTHFSGYQVQPNKRTVQLEIEAVLEKMHNKKFRFTPLDERTQMFMHRGKSFILTQT